MGTELARNCFIGVMILPALLSCTTLNHETYANHNEHPKKVVKKTVSVDIDYGKPVKITFLADVLFDPGSVILKRNDIQPLDNFAKELQNLPNNLAVIVYTDRIGSKSDNKKLSLHRAEAVKIYLISKGIDPNRIVTNGKGESSPVTGNTCGENMKREALIECLSPDRRIEIKVTEIQ